MSENREKSPSQFQGLCSVYFKVGKEMTRKPSVGLSRIKILIHLWLMRRCKHIIESIWLTFYFFYIQYIQNEIKVISYCTICVNIAILSVVLKLAIRTDFTVRLMGFMQNRVFHNAAVPLIADFHCTFGSSMITEPADNGGHELRLNQLCVVFWVLARKAICTAKGN